MEQSVRFPVPAKLSLAKSLLHTTQHSKHTWASITSVSGSRFCFITSNEAFDWNINRAKLYFIYGLVSKGHDEYSGNWQRMPNWWKVPVGCVSMLGDKGPGGWSASPNMTQVGRLFLTSIPLKERGTWISRQPSTTIVTWTQIISIIHRTNGVSEWWIK